MDADQRSMGHPRGRLLDRRVQALRKAPLPFRSRCRGLLGAETAAADENKPAAEGEKKEGDDKKAAEPKK